MKVIKKKNLKVVKGGYDGSAIDAAAQKAKQAEYDRILDNKRDY
ncbi:MAG: hypothetical protein R2799_03625 [Crocinitomicaceae bacterium]